MLAQHRNLMTTDTNIEPEALIVFQQIHSQRLHVIYFYGSPPQDPDQTRHFDQSLCKARPALFEAKTGSMFRMCLLDKYISVRTYRFILKSSLVWIGKDSAKFWRMPFVVMRRVRPSVRPSARLSTTSILALTCFTLY